MRRQDVAVELLYDSLHVYIYMYNLLACDTAAKTYLFWYSRLTRRDKGQAP